MSTKMSAENFPGLSEYDGSPIDFFQLQFEGARPKAIYFEDGIKPKKVSSKKSSPEKLYTDVNVFFASKMVFSRIELNHETGILRFFGKPDSILDLPTNIITPQRVHIETYRYKRDKKNPSPTGDNSPSGMEKKVIHAFFYNDDEAHTKLPSFLDRYDVIFCIDTGTKYPVNEASISGTGVAELKFSRLPPSPDKSRHSAMKVLPEYCRYHYDIEKNTAEQRALMFFLTIIRDNHPNKRVGIIVDFDLAKIRGYNERTCTIYNDTFYLPKNFELISASADGNPQFIVNKIMRITDAHATKMIHLGEQNALRIKIILDQLYAQQSK